MPDCINCGVSTTSRGRGIPALCPDCSKSLAGKEADSDTTTSSSSNTSSCYTTSSSDTEEDEQTNSPPKDSKPASGVSVVQEWDDDFFHIVLLQNNKDVFDAIEKFVMGKEKKREWVIQSFLLSFTKQYNNDVIQRWGVDVLFKGIDNIAQSFEGIQYYKNFGKDDLVVKKGWMREANRVKVLKRNAELLVTSSSGMCFAVYSLFLFLVVRCIPFPYINQFYPFLSMCVVDTKPTPPKSFNAWVMVPSKSAVQMMNIKGDEDSLKGLFPKGYGVHTTKSQTGSTDFYVLYFQTFEEEDEEPPCPSANWLVKRLPISRPAGEEVIAVGTYMILHKVVVDGVETNAPITIAIKEMAQVFTVKERPLSPPPAKTNEFPGVPLEK
jgi:hypothetical protein